MAIAHSRIGQLDEAVRCYRRALELEPSLAGAHYGLAFLLLKRGDEGEAQEHLEAFLAHAPQSAEAQRWVRHASSTLARLRGEAGADDGTGEDPDGWAGTGPRG